MISIHYWLPAMVTYSEIHTHTHTQPFYGSVEFVRENPGEPVPHIQK